jgi:hypothetical protein
MITSTKGYMAGILKTKVSTYEFDLTAIRDLIAADIGVPADKVAVQYVIEEVGGDPMDRFPGTDTVTKIRVTVTH